LKNSKIHRKSLVRAFLHTYLVDNLFNEQYFQNFGFAFSIEPILKDISRTTQEKIKNLLRHFEYFRTNYIFFPLILGATIKHELSHQLSLVKKTKFNMMSAVSALGDNLIYASFQPLCILCAIIFPLFIVRHTHAPLYSIVALAFIWLVYNTLMTIMRLRLFQLGIKEGIKAIFVITGWGLKKATMTIQRITAYIAGASVVFLLIHEDPIIVFNNQIQSIGYGMIVIIAIVLYFIMKMTKPIYMLYSLLIGSFIVYYFLQMV